MLLDNERVAHPASFSRPREFHLGARLSNAFQSANEAWAPPASAGARTPPTGPNASPLVLIPVFFLSSRSLPSPPPPAPPALPALPPLYADAPPHRAADDPKRAALCPGVRTREFHLDTRLSNAQMNERGRRTRTYPTPRTGSSLRAAHGSSTGPNASSPRCDASPSPSPSPSPRVLIPVFVLV
ncbi:hypothetical protein FB451DRAFT_1569939 [Mycena latifolia]|nr:hypothetical protein FB451DRAFT_1569939 [Mycena latifolia]